LTKEQQFGALAKERRFKWLVLILRQQLAYAEVEERYKELKKRDPRRFKLIQTLPSLDVRMDGTKNHGRPHVHCDIGKEKHAASVAIDNGEMIAGTLNGKQMREVRRWINSHRQVLMDLWEEMQAGRSVEALICQLQEEIG
jgi:hypothetical protein